MNIVRKQILQQANQIELKSKMDNESSQSDKEIEVPSSQTKKPANKNQYTFRNIIISSQFAGGNVKTVQFFQQFRPPNKKALNIQFYGNSDAQSDLIDKSWFFFTIQPADKSHNNNSQIEYQQIVFKFKNANVYRKFVKQKKYKPYVVYKQEYKKDIDSISQNNKGGQSQLSSVNQAGNLWQTLFLSQINILQNYVIEAQFIYVVKPGVTKLYFAENLPYNLDNLNKLHQDTEQYLSDRGEQKSSKQQSKRKNITSRVYYHRQVLAKSVDEYPIYMCTITSPSNIISTQQRQLELQDNNSFNVKSQRPFLLKNRPQIVITSRVHPSQTSSSFCVQAIIQSLIRNPDFQFLLNVFIFRIVPMVNPDGVQNGHYRLDNYLQNLNRFYGHSDPIKTPSIYIIQKMIHSLRQKSKLFLFMDIHGHNSPKPSFIFGNYCQNFYQTLQNRTFVRIMEAISQGYFDSFCCDFSQRHMTVKQKYDQHSKQASARVFAYRGSNPGQFNSNQIYVNNNNNTINYPQSKNQIQKQVIFVQHSYTLQLHPYVVTENGIRKSVTKRISKEVSNSLKSLPKHNNINFNTINYHTVVNSDVNSNNQVTSSNSNINSNNNDNNRNTNISHNSISNSNTNANTNTNTIINSNSSISQANGMIEIDNNMKKIQPNIVCNQLTELEIIEQYKKIGQSVLYSIQQILGINISMNSQTGTAPKADVRNSYNPPRSQEYNLDCLVIRKRVFKQISKMVQFYDRSKKSRSKQINKELFQRYYNRLGVLETFRQFLNTNNSHTLMQEVKTKLKQCPIHYIYEEWAVRRDKIEELNAKRKRLMEKNIEANNRNKSQNNNLRLSKNEHIQPQYSLKQQQEQQQQQNQRTETIVYSKANTRDVQIQQQSQKVDTGLSKNLKTLKFVQFDLGQKLQNRPLRQQISSNNYQYGYGIPITSIKNISNSIGSSNICSSIQKKSSIINNHISDIQSLQKKIRKLMFRHRTQNQIIQYEQQADDSRKNTNNINNTSNSKLNSNIGHLGISYVPDCKQLDQEPSKYSKRSYKSKQKQKEKDKQAQKQKSTYHNKLEPLNKNKKTKIIHLKTQQSKKSNNIIGNYNYYNYNQQLEFNDRGIVDRGGQLSQNRRLDTLQGLQPRIEQFVKKISLQKYEQNTLNSQKYPKSSQKQREKQVEKQSNFLQVKSSNMSNISISRRKKSVTRVSQERQKQKLVIIKSEEPKIHSLNMTNSTNGRYSNSNNQYQSNIYQTYIYQGSINQQTIFSNINLCNPNIETNNSQQKHLNASLFRQKLNLLYNNSGNNIYGTYKNKSKNSDAYPPHLVKKDSYKEPSNVNTAQDNINSNISKSFRVLAIEQTRKLDMIEKIKPTAEKIQQNCKVQQLNSGHNNLALQQRVYKS